MDINFLKTISEAYILDRNLTKYDKNVTSDTISDHLYSLVKELRESDFELYDKLYDRDKVTQQQIFERYLDSIFMDHINKEENTEVLTELFAETLTTLVLITLYTARQPISKAIFSTLAKLGEFFESFGKSINKLGTSFKFRYAIIQQNAEQCYQRAGIDSKNLSPLSYFQIVQTGFLSKFITTPRAIQQADELRMCYLNMLIDTIVLYSKSYFLCIKNTGGDLKLSNVDYDDVMKVVSSTNLSNHCKPFYDQSKLAFEKFDQVLHLVYPDEDIENHTIRRELIQKLRDKLYQTRQDADKQKNFGTQGNQDFKQKSFGQQNNPKPFQNKDNKRFGG